MRNRWAAALALAVVALVLAVPPAAAQPVFRDPDWLPDGSRLEPTEIGAERLTVSAGVDRLVELGRLAFRAPDMLGGNARLADISCNSCHPNGGANKDFFIPGLSDRPGTIDIADRLWNPRADDGVHDPLEIPALHGLAAAIDFGSSIRMGSLRDFTRRVIVDEFAGPEPRPDLLDALVEYQLSLAAADAPARSETDRGEGPADLPRYLAVLDQALADEDAALAGLVSRMIRSALGRLHTANAAPTLSLAAWARAVADIAAMAETQAASAAGPAGFAAARTALARLQAEVRASLP